MKSLMRFVTLGAFAFSIEAQEKPFVKHNLNGWMLSFHVPVTMAHDVKYIDYISNPYGSVATEKAGLGGGLGGKTGWGFGSWVTVFAGFDAAWCGVDGEYDKANWFYLEYGLRANLPIFERVIPYGVVSRGSREVELDYEDSGDIIYIGNEMNGDASTVTNYGAGFLWHPKAFDTLPIFIDVSYIRSEGKFKSPFIGKSPTGRLQIAFTGYIDFSSLRAKK